MLFSIDELKFKFKDYSNIFEKIKVEENNSRLIKIKRSLYSDNINENPFFIANNMFSPSYISFETALSYYNIIPERVDVIKSATYKKNKTKIFNSRFGTFIYKDINANAYPYGIDLMTVNNYIILIASKEKALIDTLSIVSPRNSIKEIETLLFNDLRINEFELDKMDKNQLIEFCDLYPSNTLKQFKKYIRRKYDK